MKNVVFALEELMKRPLFCILTVIQLTVSFTAIFFGISATNYLSEKSIQVSEIFKDNDYYVIDISKSDNSVRPHNIDLNIYRDFMKYIEEQQISLYLLQSGSMFISNSNIEDSCLDNFDRDKIGQEDFQRVKVAYINDLYLKDIGIELSEGSFENDSSENIPIVVGDNYKSVFKLNDKVPYIYTEENGEKIIRYLQVVGFIKKDSYMCIKGDPDNIINMNDYISICRKADESITNFSNEQIKKVDIYNYYSNAYYKFSDLDKLKEVESKTEELGLNYKFTEIKSIQNEFQENFASILLPIKFFAVSILTFTIISIIVVMLNMVIRSIKEFGINMLVGAKSYDISLRIFFQIFILFAISVTCTIAIVAIFLKDNIVMNLNCINICELLVIAVVMSILISIIPIVKFKRTSINNIIKGSV